MVAIVPVCLLAGIVISLIGLAICRLDGKNEKRCTRRTAGYVLDNVNKQELYFPLLAYEIDGVNYTTEYKTGTRKVKYMPKKTVVLMVNPDDHTDIYVKEDGPGSYKRKGQCLMAAGLAIVALAIAALVL